MTVADLKKAKLEELKAKALNKELKEINDVLDRIVKGEHTPQDISTLRQKILSMRVNGDNNIIKIGDVCINIGQGRDIHIGDRIYQGISADAIRDVIYPQLQKHESAIKEQIKEIKVELKLQKEKELDRQQELERQKELVSQEKRERQKDFQRISVVQPNTQGVSNSQTVRVNSR